eukprot:TRINITY_DN30096_c0_g1_i1.p1 TRINITY_DN30096_c0_g1~~TRINITY_DN30096_c0_g1_i1.p1  ORF type:complete len:308 (+),score=57.46 TRINITY_DN30096_c0_g1_i1:70-993(+)
MDKAFACMLGAGTRDTEIQVFDAPGHQNSAYSIKIVPALSDNYMYVIINHAAKTAVAIDPVDAPKVMRVCEDADVQLAAILTTHYHADHSGGNEALAEMESGVEVLAGEGDADRTPAVTRSLTSGETFTAGGLPFVCIATPCHTRGHVSFFLDAKDGQAPALFCGDTLFVAGCGRFMEGGPEDMQASLSTLMRLPPTTRVFCGHEYTIPNLEFAAVVDPGNEVIEQRLRDARQKRERGLPTIPSTLEMELQYNPFLRVTEPSIAEAVGCCGCQDPLKVMAKLRRKKDTFTTVGTLITFALDVKGFFQ